MRVAVAAHLMPGVANARDEIGMTLGDPAEHEARRLHAGAIEQGEDTVAGVDDARRQGIPLGGI
jgi:hypothetical protein